MQRQFEVLVWKDINKADDPLTKLQIQRFWACFMFLFVMPPKHRDPRGNAQWRFRTYSSRIYVPQCRYDEFIASHSTSCEHHTNYFCYYHRNLISKYQLALNEADYALRNNIRGDDIDWVRREVRTRQLDQPFNKAITYYQDLIKKIQAERKKINPSDEKIPWVAGFYWNCANFKEKIKIPQIFSHPPKQGQNPMFDFHRAYKGCNFGEVNYNETWEKDETGVKWWNRINYFGRTLDRFTREEQRLIHAEEKNLEQRVQAKSNISRKINYNSSFRSYDNLQKRNGVTTLSNLTEDELNYNLGGVGCEFIKTDEIRDSEIYSDYNQEIPYYTYVKALLTPFQNMCPRWNGANGFLSGRDSISTPHDQIHNNNGFILGDPSFSITHPLFMLYHGFIEYMTEQYLRMVRKYDVNQRALSSLIRFLNGRIPFNDFRSGNRSMQMRFGSFFIGYYYNHWRTLRTNGDYPCFEWFDNTLDSFSQLRDDVTHYSRGLYQDLMAVRDSNGNVTSIRYSDQLRGFYETQINDMKLPEQLKEFPFNFTFDILLDNQRLDRDYPDYIQEVVSEVRMNELKNSSKLAFRTASPAPMIEEEMMMEGKTSSSVPPNSNQIASNVEASQPILLKQNRVKIQNFLMMNFQKVIKQNLGPSLLKKIKQFPDSNPQFLHEMKKIEQKTKQFNKNVEKFCSLYGRVQYPSNLGTFVVRLMLKIKDLKEFKFRNTGEQSISKLKNKIVKSGGEFGIERYPVFNKSNLSQVCPRCLSKKVDTFNLCNSFKGSIYPMLIDLHANINYGILYDSQGHSPIERSFTELLETDNNHPERNFHFQIISGAVQVKLNIIKCSNVYGNEKIEQDNTGISYQIYLKAESFDLISGFPFIWLKAKKSSLNTEIIFEQLEIPRDPNTKQNGKQLVYKHFVGQIFIRDGTKTEVKDFEFDIKNYFFEACYDIRIDKNHNILVRDSNIEEKRKIFF